MFSAYLNYYDEGDVKLLFKEYDIKTLKWYIIVLRCIDNYYRQFDISIFIDICIFIIAMKK